MRIPTFYFLCGLCYCLIGRIFTLDPSSIVVSLTLDADSEKVTRQALRLLTSLRYFGGSLASSRLAVCITHSNDFHNDALLQQLSTFNISSLIYAPRYSYPSYAPSLNKLCSLHPLILRPTDHLLYLDADIVIANDPLPILEQYVDADISCGYAWDGMPNIELFPDYVNSSHEFAHTMPTISPGGSIYYGMCNTGMFFVRGAIIPQWLAVAKQYLAKSHRDEYIHLIPFAPTYYGIDSVILWAAQYALGLTIAMMPLQMNYILAAEDYIYRHIEYDDGMVTDLDNAWSAESIIRPRTLAGQRVQFNASQVYLAHLSTGSDAFFSYRRKSNTCPFEYRCVVNFKGQLSTAPGALVRSHLIQKLTNPAFCGAVADLTNVTLDVWLGQQPCVLDDDTFLHL